MEKEPEYTVEENKDFSMEKWSETLRFLIEMETRGKDSDYLKKLPNIQKDSFDQKE